MIRTLLSWFVFLGIFFRYILYRLRLCVRPDMTEHYDAVYHVIGTFLRWDTRLRIVKGERCPTTHPAVYAANHLRLEDPFVCWAGAYKASDKATCMGFMMRDDFFKNAPWCYFPVDWNELCEMGGAVTISRDKVQLSQLRPLLRLLNAPGSFLMFPGGTRSRSGFIIEYREGNEEPGGVSFFINHVQRAHAELRVPAIPITRTYNPVTKCSAIVFGEPLFLEPRANREKQRDFDLALTVHISNGVEINMLHILSGILYLYCLHHCTYALTLSKLMEMLQSFVAHFPAERYLDPAVKEKTEQEIRAVSQYLQEHNMLTLQNDTLKPHSDAILAAPPLESSYRKRNPIKYQVNQFLHLADLVYLLEDVTLP